MPALLARPITADEFDRELVHQSGIELIDGVVVELPMPGPEHGEVCANAGGILRDFVKRRKLGRVMSNDTFVRVSPDRVRGPDVCYVSYARLPAEVPTPRTALVPPLELAVEVKSPYDSLPELAGKCGEFLVAGVLVALLLNPDDSTATVYRTNEPPRVLPSRDELTLPDILPGFAVRVGEFFE